MEYTANNNTINLENFFKIYSKIKQYQCNEDSIDFKNFKIFIKKNKITNKKMEELLSLRFRQEIEINVKGSIFDENASDCEIVIQDKYHKNMLKTNIIGTRKELENYNWSECLINYKDTKTNLQRLCHETVFTQLRKTLERREKKLNNIPKTRDLVYTNKNNTKIK